MFVEEVLVVACRRHVVAVADVVRLDRCLGLTASEVAAAAVEEGHVLLEPGVGVVSFRCGDSPLHPLSVDGDVEVDHVLDAEACLYGLALGVDADDYTVEFLNAQEGPDDVTCSTFGKAEGVVLVSVMEVEAVEDILGVLGGMFAYALEFTTEVISEHRSVLVGPYGQFAGSVVRLDENPVGSVSYHNTIKIKSFQTILFFPAFPSGALRARRRKDERKGNLPITSKSPLPLPAGRRTDVPSMLS